MNTPPVLSSDTLVEVLERTGVTHVMGIPDNTSGPVFDLLADHRSIQLVTVSREGEAFAIASGVWLGGGHPFVIVQNTGLLESGDAIRGTAARMGVPLPVMVTGRGYAKMARAGLGPEVDLDGELVRRANIDSVALHTEPTLDAWGIPYTLAATETDPSVLEETITRARAEERPVVFLLTQPLA